MTLNEILVTSLYNKTLRHTNQYGRKVELKIEDVKIEHYSVDLEPATAANDWWPPTSESYSVVLYLSDGSTKNVYFTENLDIL
jgi:hypothetical protein